jgi:uncharacterized protein (DUF169 family)
MEIQLKDKFLRLWEEYFGKAELPIILYYTDNTSDLETAAKPKGWRCFIGELTKVRKGQSLVFSEESVSCGGGKRYLGYSTKPRPGFEYFLSCGNAEIEGERYKQSPELVEEFLANAPVVESRGKNMVFKRWDNLIEDDHPEVVIFFATPDVLSALYTLSNFDRKDLNGVIAPFGAGCATIIQYPLMEAGTEHPRSVMGMFDISARPYVPENVITMAIPFGRFQTIVAFMEESFLITESWGMVKKRISK